MTQIKNPLSLPPPYRFLEAVRGIAALWVVAFHALVLVAAFDPAMENHPLVLPFHKGFLGVEVFFVVSGYCIANAACSALAKPRPLGTFAFARVRRIFPPCWASLGLFVIAAVVTTWLQRHGHRAQSYLVELDLAHQSFAFYFSNLTLTQIVLKQPFLSIVCWTLCYEIAFYLIVAIALFFARTLVAGDSRSQMRPMLNLLHLLTFACCGFLLLAPQLLPYPLDLWVQFGLGVALFDAVASPRSGFVRAILLSIFGLIALFLFIRNVPIGYTQDDSRWTYSTALFATILLYACHKFDARLIRLLPVRFAAFVGHFSYSLYLINFLAISGIMILVRPIPLSPMGHVAAVYGITLLILIPAYAFFWLFERPFLGRRSTSRLLKTESPVAAVPSSAAAPEASPPVLTSSANLT